MNKRERERAYKKVVNMIRSRAHAFTRKYGGADYEESYKEFFTQACWGFMQACEKWKGGRGSKFSSWCYLKVNVCLLHHVRERFSDRLTFVEQVKDEMLPPAPPSAESSAAFRNSLADQTKDLSPEALRMLAFIIDNPFPDGDAKPKEVLRFAREEMSFQGYDHAHLEIMIHEIKSALY